MAIVRPGRTRKVWRKKKKNDSEIVNIRSQKNNYAGFLVKERKVHK